MMTPSLADWLQGWGTVAGSVFSALAALTALALLWHEVKYRRQDLYDTSLQQARNVLVTVETPSRPIQLDKIEIVAHNFTNEVILNLYIRVHRRDSGTEVVWMSADIFEPGRRWPREVILSPVIHCDIPEHPPELFDFNYWYTDSHGRHWHRVDRQPPRRIREHPAVEWAAYKHRRIDEPRRSAH